MASLNDRLDNSLGTNVDTLAIDSFAQTPIWDTLSASPTEVFGVIKQLSNYEIPWSSGIKSEISKYKTEELIQKLIEFLSSAWNNGIDSQEF